jgi:hypothetical protein
MPYFLLQYTISNLGLISLWNDVNAAITMQDNYFGIFAYYQKSSVGVSILVKRRLYAELKLINSSKVNDYTQSHIVFNLSH